MCSKTELVTRAIISFLCFSLTCEYQYYTDTWLLRRKHIFPKYSKNYFPSICCALNYILYEQQLDINFQELRWTHRNFKRLQFISSTDIFPFSECCAKFVPFIS
ncbi:hypothetical protein HHI36_005692 [Cryptolaemus montrouzieri]|uniref:Secreted protein n=1 Tax=Cryptolaemus montrouzieri TaxID=559131 RepID=A0ABD2NV53_9CUCU